MKTLNKLLIGAISMVFMLGCTKSLDEGHFGNLRSGELGMDKTHETKMVTMPFMGHFSVGKAEESVYADGGIYEHMVGSGEITHFGNMSFDMKFFVSLPSSSYSTSVPGTFVAANGDILYVTGDGQIGPYTGDNDFYQAYFNDKIIFAGGTGRFEGATGFAYTNAFVHVGTEGDPNDPFRTDFFIKEGIITLMKGK